MESNDCKHGEKCCRKQSFSSERLPARNPPVNLQDLEKLSWSGVPASLRSRVWKILCGYLPPGKSDEAVKRKREEYAGYVNQYFNNKEEDIHKDTFRSDGSQLRIAKPMIFLLYRQIAIDVPRMSPLVGLFQQRCVQEMVERILYIWAIRHPASGYVQGINDLVTPFLMVFLQVGSGRDRMEIFYIKLCPRILLTSTSQETVLSLRVWTRPTGKILKRTVFGA